MKHPDYSGGRVRLRNRDQLNAEIEAITRARTSAEWIERLNAAGVPCGPIYRIDEVFASWNVAPAMRNPKASDCEYVKVRLLLYEFPSKRKAK